MHVLDNKLFPAIFIANVCTQYLEKMLVLPLLLQGLEWVELSGCLSQLDRLLGFE